MMRHVSQLKLPFIFTVLIVFTLSLFAKGPDEGMWTFDNPPVKQLEKRYHFTPTPEWLEHVRLSAVRFNDGGSGSFVSPNGLVMTNHHVGVGQIQKLSTPERDLVTTGFYAQRPEDELKCPDLELNVLVETINVTEQVLSAAKEGMTDEEVLKARQAKIAQIEKESQDKTGLRSDVVDLYHGGEYWLYRYKKYTDVRLVFAPERQVAYFGGDLDNFTYPRYDLDVSFFRIYENGRPLKTDHYFEWNRDGAEENELVFVVGNPGSTNRLYTHAQLEYERDYWYPLLLKYIDGRMAILKEYAKQGPEQERQALIQMFGLGNAKKALTGEYQGLLDEEIMKLHKEQEAAFLAKLAKNPEWQKEYAPAWKTIEDLYTQYAKEMQAQFYRGARGSKLLNFALQLVRYAEEIEKPDQERLEGYHEAELERRKFYLLSKAPIYKELEKANFAGVLQMAIDVLGENDPYLKTMLDGKSPRDAATSLIDSTRLNDPEVRKALLEGGKNAIRKSNDPLIKLAGKIDPMLRKDRQWYKENIESVKAAASEKIARARFEVYGKSTYPDATFTLRLAYGAVKGYQMNGTEAPYKTTLYGLYDRSLSFDKKGDFALPERFWERQDKLDLSTPVNFVSTADIIGGNSGSPVINRNAQIVGLIFDGNIESLVGRFVYDETKNRAVAVHSAYIIEALQKLYDAQALAEEILSSGAHAAN